MGGPGGVAGVMAGGANVGPPSIVLDLNQKRYIDVTDQVRRMPVALVLVVDQLFLQDTLVAYANSSLRFQVTQYHWNRFRGTITTGTEGVLTGGFGSGRPGPGGGFPGSGAGYPGGFGGSSSETGSPGGPPGKPGRGPGSSGFGPPPAMGSSGFGPPSGVGGGSSEGGFGFGGVGSMGSTTADAQASAGLVELTVYGIVTIYEKYDQAVADGTAPAADATAAPAAKPAP
jgi:hypothetical protein